MAAAASYGDVGVTRSAKIVCSMEVLQARVRARVRVQKSLDRTTWGAEQDCIEGFYDGFYEGQG